MKEVVIRYKNPKTLEVLKSLASYFDFSLTFPAKSKVEQKEYEFINGIPVVPGDRSIDVKGLNKVFTGKKLDSKKIRSESWQKQK